MRWWSEFRYPKLKCERLGHKIETRRQKVFLYPPTGIFRMRHVADRATEEFSQCSRCGLETERAVVKREGLNGLTLDSDKMDLLMENGRLTSGSSYLVSSDGK